MTRTRTQSRLRIVAVLAVAGYLLIAHGCHGGDHDTELSLHSAIPEANPPGEVRLHLSPEVTPDM